MKVRDKNNTDISDNIYSLDGVEIRRNVEGGIVIPEMSFSSDLEYDLGDGVKIFDETDTSCLSCYITAKTFDYENRLFEYEAKDLLAKLQDFNFFSTQNSIFYDMRITFMNQEWPYNVTPSDFTLFEDGMTYKQNCIPVIPFIKFCLLKSGVSLSDIVYTDFSTHIDGYYISYDIDQSTDESRDVLLAPLSHIYMDIGNYYFGSQDTFFDALNKVLRLLDLYIVYYNNKYYIKKNGSSTLPDNDSIYRKNDEVIAVYDHFETKVGETPIVYPGRVGIGYTDNDSDKITFGVFYRITRNNSPTPSFDQSQHDGRFFAMITTHDSILAHYSLSLSGTTSVFTSDPTRTSEVPLPSSDDFVYNKYRYNLYLVKKLIGKTGLSTKIKSEIETDLSDQYWTNTSTDPLSISIDYSERKKTIEVII